MKANLIINFKKINGIEVNNSLIKANPNLFSLTQKTIFILSEQILKYFKEHNIDVEIKFQLKNYD
jgi:hypothetical protein